MKPVRCLLMMLALCLDANAAEPVSMAPENWTIRGEAEFAAYKGFDALKLKQASDKAVSNTVALGNGSIEFDVEPQGVMGVGIGFRRQDAENYEDFYFRPKPDCDKAKDCVQYAPMVHGVLLWDFFPQYQAAAPLKDGAWNHVKLTLSGRRLNVYINGSLVLAVGRLEGDGISGGLILHGPGVFANLTVRSEEAEGLSPLPQEDAGDGHFLRRWQVSPILVLPAGKEPAFAEMPADRANWQPVAAERGGLINLTRLYGKPVPTPNRALAWLKTSVRSNKAQTKTVRMALCREAWVFANGQQVFADKNPYQPPQTRKAPDGRCTIQNATFTLPLKAGVNDIAVAVANNFYGWGIAMKIDDLNGLRHD